MSSEAKILPIEKSAVLRICSGQVVLDLAVATKELLENSLDAGATAVEIKFKDYGADCVEVSDNGRGVDPADYASFALRNHTSKLSVFSDLANLRSFGFRGEALNSLCSLAEVLTVKTCTDGQAPAGTMLEFDARGALVNQTPVAREKGTTVCVSKLFHPLPVRRKEFLRNLKREYAKALNMIQAYALISEGVRIRCTHQQGKGARQVFLSTPGSKSLRENISNVFGAKALLAIMPFDIVLIPEKENDDDELRRQVRLRGYISKPNFGSGRSSSDRQYYYVNRRPCELPKFAKTVNEVYRSFNTNQVPFVVADLELDTGAYDVNVNPDKRTIFLHNEPLLVEALRERLTQAFEPSRSTYAVRDSLAGNHVRDNHQVEAHADSRESSPGVNSTGSQEDPVERSPSPNIASGGAALPTDDAEQASTSAKESLSAVTTSSSRKHLSNFGFRQDAAASVDDSHRGQPPSRLKQARLPFATELRMAAKRPRLNVMASSSQSLLSMALRKYRLGGVDDGGNSVGGPEASGNLLEQASCEDAVKISGNMLEDNADDAKESGQVEGPARLLPEDIQEDALLREAENDGEAEQADADASGPGEQSQATQAETELENDDAVLAIDMTRFRSRLEDVQRARDLRRRRRRGCAGNPVAASVGEDSDVAEREISRVIRKRDFARMLVLGQFNLGFIVVKLAREGGGGDDLFIIDQHASDEKYNFETLQATTVMQSQPLIRPRTIELSAMEECTALENLDELNSSGFKVTVDHDAPTGAKLRLLSVPYSKNTQFDVKDVEELIHLISERPGKMVRGSRVVAMFASRACRKSVMIGDPLNKVQMEKIVRHMGEVDQPWNCPHGRPTMRHLFDVSKCLPRRNEPRLCLGSLYQVLGLILANES